MKLLTESCGDDPTRSSQEPQVYLHRRSCQCQTRCMDRSQPSIRRQLLLLNRERIEFAYVKAQANALDDPVILVLDLQDDSAEDWLS